jgi:hypothetical protein
VSQEKQTKARQNYQGRPLSLNGSQLVTFAFRSLLCALQHFEAIVRRAATLAQNESTLIDKLN